MWDDCRLNVNGFLDVVVLVVALSHCYDISSIVEWLVLLKRLIGGGLVEVHASAARKREGGWVGGVCVGQALSKRKPQPTEREGGG